ncbi:MAG TPA: TonB-dependent receptor [Bryobacteraceae bacterium]|nr:TonB-dependent receptor [Bryobacteraceae bacterium]
MQLTFWRTSAGIFLLAALGYGQNIRGTILGTVHDEAGAIVRGAAVTVEHVQTGLTRKELTNDVGEYLFTQLPVGNYNVTVEQTGFKKTERDNVLLQVDDKVRVDLTLTIGTVSETIAVEGTAPVISTDSATVGNVVDHKEVTELPLNGRQFLQLNLLVPGANQGVKGSQNQTQGGSISVNGAREQANNFLLDGIDNNDLAINQYSVSISPDAIQEFKVQESTYSAEFGRSGGAQINVAVKSGTNQFHGVGYEYLRNSDLDAKNFFDKPAPAPIPPYKRNQFGTAIGGPIKKDKTFFFFNWESTRIRQSITKQATVPTDAMKGGDFSALLPNTIIYDPNSINASGQRSPFMGNIIPSRDFSAVGQAILALYPSPNLPGVGASSGLFVSSDGKTDDFDQFTGRVDHRFSEADSLFGRYTFSKENRFDTFDPFCAGSHNIPGYGCNTLNGGQGAVLDEIHLFGPTRINEFRFGYNRTRGGIFQQDQNTDASTQLGILGTSRNPIDYGTPLITPSGYDTVGDAGNLPQDRKDNTYQVTDTFSWTHGKHNFKFGEDFRRFQLNLLFDSNARGSETFQPYYTTAAANSTVGGNSIAELLLGDPEASSVSRSFAGLTASDVTGFRTSSIDFFAQDDWRVSPKLTLNLGIRWEYNTPVIDKYNHLATFDPTVTGDIRTASAQNPQIYTAPKDQFAPRIGFAYTPFGNKTVFRGGYGVYWDEKLLNIHLTPALSPPFVVPLSFQPSSNGVPNINIASPYAGSAASSFPGSTWIENPFRNGYVQQWSFNVQRELPAAMGITVGYVGSKGTHLDREYNANLPQPSPLFSQSNRPYPAFAGITVDSASASSIYHAFEVSLEKRLTKGLSFRTAYTYSKAIDDDSAWNATVVDPFNFHTERGLSTFDTRSRLVAAYTYNLPFGQGQPFLSHMSKLGEFFLGGWQTNGILSVQSGNPLDPTVGLTNLTGTNTGTRPDVVAGCNPNNFPHDPTDWFNGACFTHSFLGRFGDAGRDILIGPGTTNFDVSLLKNFPLFHEGRYIQFRSEFFNVFNHPNFDNPNVTEISTSFGRVPSAGIQDPYLSSRQIQFALRLVF